MFKFKLNLKSIKTKLGLIISSFCLVVIGIIIFYTTLVARNQIIEFKKSQAQKFGYICAERIENVFQKALSLSRNLSFLFSLHNDPDSPHPLSRHQVNEILKTTLIQNAYYLGTFAVWDCESFPSPPPDMDDSTHCDSRGRFTPFWSRDGHENIRLEHRRGYDIPGMGDFYLVPRKAQSEVLIGPYMYEFNGTPCRIVSAVAPIRVHDCFYGVVGVDISIKRLHSLFEDLDDLVTRSQMVLISNHGIPALLSPDHETDPYDTTRLESELAKIQNGNHFNITPEGRSIDIRRPIRMSDSESPWSVVIHIPMDHVYHETGVQMWKRILIGFLLTFGAILIFIYFTNRLINPLEAIAEAAGRASLGDLDYRDIHTSDDEIGHVNDSMRRMIHSLKEIESVCRAAAVGDFSHSVNIRSKRDVLSQSVNQMTENFRHVVQQARKIASGNYNVEYCPISRTDELGNALFEMTRALHEMNEENMRRHRLKSSQMELHDLLSGEQQIPELADNILRYLCIFLDADFGAFYTRTESNACQLTAVLVRKNRKLSGTVDSQKSLIDQAAAEKRTMMFSDVTPKRLNTLKGQNDTRPTTVIAMPILLENSVMGVIEFEAHHDLTELEQAFLEQSSDRIAIALNSAIIREKMTCLLNQGREQAEKLQSQQEELKNSNEELEAKTRLLLKQKADIQKKNIELKKTGELVEQKAMDLERSDRYKSEFLSNMSHELRTPLNSILLLSKLLLENNGGNLNQKQLAFCQTIHASGSELLNMINNILDFSKVEAGKMPFNIKTLVLSDFAEKMKHKFRSLFEEKGLTFVIRVNADVPDRIQTDPQRAEQILNNFLSNAYKFTFNGTVRLTIGRPESSVNLSEIGLTPEASIAFSVSDTGIGIPIDKQELIFEAFQQADGTTSRNFGGTGLGLAISKKYAESLGGEIQLFSDIGKGSKFTLCIPEAPPKELFCDIVKSSEARSTGSEKRVGISKERLNSTGSLEKDPQIFRYHSAKPPLKKNETERAFNGKKLLLIDEDMRNVYSVSSILEEKGARIIVGKSLNDGLKHLGAHSDICLVLMDIRFVQAHGCRIIKGIRSFKDYRDLPMIFMTKKEYNGKLKKYMKSAGCDCISKPIDIEKFMECLRRHLAEVTNTKTV